MTQTLHFPECAGAFEAFWGGTQGGAVWRRINQDSPIISFRHLEDLLTSLNSFTGQFPNNYSYGASSSGP
jgi:hypothetical protein